VILVEHEMDVIRRVSDRCVVLNFGRKIFEGSFDALIANPEWPLIVQSGHTDRLQPFRRAALATLA